MNADRQRLTFALLLSLLIHALLLNLTFGGEGVLPGFGFPWQERRVEAPDLRVVLMSAPVAAAEPPGMAIQEPLQQASGEQPAAGRPTSTPSASPAPTPDRMAAAIAPDTDRTTGAEPTAEVKPEPEVTPKPEPDVATAAAPETTPSRTGGSGDAAPTPVPEPEVISVARNEPVWVVPAAASAPTAVIAAAPSASSPETVAPAPPDAGDTAQKAETQQQAVQWAARQEVSRHEAERVEAARRGVERQEVVRQAAVRQEVARQESARQAAQRVETARLEAEREESTRQAAATQEAVRAETARLEAERPEAARRTAARQEAERVESARLDAERDEVARQAAARQAAARLEAAQQDEARREASRRAMGRRLDEEAARRDAASTAADLPSWLAPSSSGARRGRLFGRTDANAELILYAEAWARKIELNPTFDMVRDLVRRPHTHPLVTVAIRSDGSVESVTFVLSSGVAEVDEAIRRIVQSQLPYQAFPPGLSREFDVIEIRRTWLFDSAIRLY